MTQVFRDDGVVVPVTRVQAGPCVVTAVKHAAEHGKEALQLGYGSQKLFRLTKPEQGHVRGITQNGDRMTTVRHLHDVPVEPTHGLERGNVLTLEMFQKGDTVQVTGYSKGRGFQGVVKRHGFKGGPASHGHKDNLRMPGSIGATGPQRVFKGTRMAGHMGDEKVTVKNLEIIDIHPESGELLIKGAVPGAPGGLLVIVSASGIMQPTALSEPSAVLASESVGEENLFPEVSEPRKEEAGEKTIDEKPNIPE